MRARRDSDNPMIRLDNEERSDSPNTSIDQAPPRGEIDVDILHQSLRNASYFDKRKHEKLKPVLMYEVNCYGESSYQHRTLRELLSYVNREAKEIDRVAAQKEAEESLNKSPSRRSSIPRDFNLGGSSSSAFTGTEPLAELVTGDNGMENVEYDAVGELRMRDLRRLDYQFNPNEEKSVLIRRHAVLFAMDPLRAVVMANRLILIVPDGADSLLSTLDHFVKEWTSAAATAKAKPDVNVGGLQELPTAAGQRGSATISFESHAYEALLTTVNSLESQEFLLTEKSVNSVLGYFKTGSLLPIEIQEKMRTLKNSLSILGSRINISSKVLSELTEDDEQMALMNLTYLRDKPKLYKYPLVPEIQNTHDEMEELLEGYLIDCNSLASKITHVRNQIQSAEELVSLRLDTSRNELLIANTALAVLACSIGFGAYITGVFGMNLDNVELLQPVNNLFAAIAVITFAIIGFLFVTIMYYLQVTGMIPTRHSVLS